MKTYEQYIKLNEGTDIKVGDTVIIVDNPRKYRTYWNKNKHKILGIVGVVRHIGKEVIYLYTNTKLDNIGAFRTNSYKSNIIIWKDYVELYDDIEDTIEEWDDEMNENVKHKDGFSVGDRVLVNGYYEHGIDRIYFDNQYGYITEILPDSYWLGIEFDKRFHQRLHNNGGVISKDNRGFYLKLTPNIDIKVIPNIEGNIEEWDETNESIDNDIKVGDKVIIVDNPFSNKSWYGKKHELLGITGEVMKKCGGITFIKIDDELTSDFYVFDNDDYGADIVMWNDYLELYNPIEGEIEEWNDE